MKHVNRTASKAWLFSIEELELVEKALTEFFEKHGDNEASDVEELLNDLRLCIAGKL